MQKCEGLELTRILQEHLTADEIQSQCPALALRLTHPYLSAHTLIHGALYASQCFFLSQASLIAVPPELWNLPVPLSLHSESAPKPLPWSPPDGCTQRTHKPPSEYSSLSEMFSCGPWFTYLL